MNWKMRYFWGPAIVVALIAAIPAIAQQPPAKPEVSFYRLDLVLRELEDAKVVNTRSYSMWLSTGDDRGGVGASVRAGNQIPIVSTTTGEKPAAVSYRTVGINLDCRLTESGSGPVLWMNGSIDNVVPPEQGQDNKMVAPILRTINFNAYTLLTLGKAALISSVDDPGSKSRFQLEVTATKLK